ncbi:MAG: hypothetical protein ABJZ55_01935 [Fuerstiella sp.]
MIPPIRQSQSGVESSDLMVPDKRQAALRTQHYETLVELRRHVVNLLNIREGLKLRYSAKAVSSETVTVKQLEETERKLRRLDKEIELMKPVSKDVDDELSKNTL